MSYEQDLDNYVHKQLVCEGVVENAGDGEYLVRGVVQNGPSDALITYWAANPPTFSTSYAGSALPYANPLMAYENTPNKGSVRAVNGQFQFRVYYPNAYYAGLGTVYVKPHVNIKVNDSRNPSGGETHKIELGEGVPFRTLTYAPPPSTYPRKNALFYSGRESLPVRTQEQILRSAAFPEKNIYPNNFWGLKPPQ
jgi:hypothetical protein